MVSLSENNAMHDSPDRTQDFSSMAKADQLAEMVASFKKWAIFTRMQTAGEDDMLVNRGKRRSMSGCYGR